MKTIISLLLLNGLLSFTSWWPTIAVQPDARIAPEFFLLMLALSIAVAARQTISPRMVNWLASAYLLLMLGRYVDVVAPALFGRPVSLYWDLPQLPRFIWVTVTGSPWWMTALAATGISGVVWGLHWAVARCLTYSLAGLCAVIRKPALWCVLAPLSALIGANYAGVQATWPYVSKPVIPTYAREVGLLADALLPDRANRLLPPSDTIGAALEKGPDRALSALQKRDVMLMFLESHGAVLYDNPSYAARVADSLNHLERSIESSGRYAVSAFFRSATIGGASDLAHLSLLSGIDLSDPRRHDLLVTTQRPTLLTVFKRAGYDIHALYHSVYWDWRERSYYGFDTYLSGPDLGYTGPEFGFWKIPDQYAIARYAQLHPRTAGGKPRITVFSTMSTHFPFVPVPPYQPDWQRLLGPEPFEPEAARQAQKQPVNWLNMGPDYVRTVNYAHTWLSDWFLQPEGREVVYLLIGDHQPTSNIAGEGASWDVPVYIVSRDARLLDAFREQGFSDGMRPRQRPPLGGLNDLTAYLLKAFGQDGH